MRYTGMMEGASSHAVHGTFFGQLVRQAPRFSPLVPPPQPPQSALHCNASAAHRRLHKRLPLLEPLLSKLHQHSFCPSAEVTTPSTSFPLPCCHGHHCRSRYLLPNPVMASAAAAAAASCAGTGAQAQPKAAAVSGIPAAATAEAEGMEVGPQRPVVLVLGPMHPKVLEILETFADVRRLERWFTDNEGEEEQRWLSGVGSSVHGVVTTCFGGFPEEFYNRLPRLEIVATFGVGMDHIDIARAKARGILLTNTPDVLTDDVADLAMALILTTSRRICEADRYLRAGKWVTEGNMPLTRKVSQKTVGILGLGRIGKAVAKRAEAFGCKIAYHSRHPKPDIEAPPGYAYHATPTSLATASDFLVVACALTPETTHIVNVEVLTALGPSGILINVGRGAHVDEGALVEALQQGKIAGAGLDVYEKEPCLPGELAGMDNVVLLPHVGTGTHETRDVMAELTANNVRAHFEGNPVLTPV